MKKVSLLFLSLIAVWGLNAQQLEPGAPGVLIDLTPENVNITNEEAGNGNYGKKIMPIGDMLLFTAEDDDHGDELWITDGSVEGTMLLKDIWPGDSSSAPTYFEAVDDKVFFVANDGTNGTELWMTDGTTDGTQIVKDIFVGESSANPDMITPYNDKILFRAVDEFSNLEQEKWLWISDGTPEGTMLVEEIQIRFSGDSEPPWYFIQVMGEKAFFVGQDDLYGEELWVTDGTEEGTHMVLDIGFKADTATGAPDGATSSTKIEWQFVANDEQLLFRAETPAWWVGLDDSYESIGEELWVTDGTAAGTYPLGDFNPAVESDDVTRTQGTQFAFPILYNNQVFFRADDGEHNVELCVTDLTPEGTRHVVNICGEDEEGNDRPSWLQKIQIFDDKLFMQATPWNQAESEDNLFPNIGRELFYYDAVEDTIVLVKNFSGANAWPWSFVEGERIVNDKIYYHAEDSTEERKMYAILPPSEYPDSLYAVYTEQGFDVDYHSLTNGNERLFFISEFKQNAEDDITVKRLYVYDDGEQKTPNEEPLAVGPAPTDLNNDRIDEYVQSIMDTCDYVPCEQGGVGIENITANTSFDVYPNPASEFIQIELYDNLKQANTAIVNSVGQIVWRGKIENGTRIDTKEFKPGVYVIMIAVDGTLERKNLVIR